MSDDLEFIVIDDIPEYIFCIGDDEENEQVIAIRGKDGAFKYEKVAELPTTGEDGVLYLVPKAHTTQTASGNPISVNITDGAGKIESLKLDGDTFQQSYTGKNLLQLIESSRTISGVTLTLNSDGTFGLAGTATADIEFSRTVSLAGSGIVGDQSYTISSDAPIETYGIAYYVHSVNSVGQWNKTLLGFRSAGTQTAATPSTDYIKFVVRVGNGTTVNYPSIKTMIEAGSTASAYEPYVGGQASPSPSYPQDINVVTGSQTVSINGANYLIDLGSIELCKLGTYQDYIYKDGENWKVHKATSKATFSDLNWQDYQIGSTGHYRVYSSGIAQIVLPPSANNVNFIGYCSIYTNRTSSRTYARDEGCSIQGDGYANTGTIFIYDADYDYSGAATNWKTARGAGQIYFVLKTATDTVITDTTLIAQLEAARTAALSTGSNTISNTTTGTSLAGDLEIGYYGYDPLNKYDKYFWLDIDGGYESL